MAFTEDMGAFFSAREFGVTAVFGAATAQVILDQPDVEIMSGRIQSTEYLMTYAAADLPSLAQDSTGTVDGVAYKVREVRAVDDGRVKQAILEAT